MDFQERDHTLEGHARADDGGDRKSEIAIPCAEMDVNERRMDEAEVDKARGRYSERSEGRCTCIVVPCTRWADSSRLAGSWHRLSGWHADSSDVSHFSEISPLFPSPLVATGARR